MLKVILIDDEPDARFLLRHALEQHFAHQVQIVAEADGCQTGLHVLNNTTCDLVFMDIKMGDGTGFDILAALDKPSFAVVFVTAFDSFAIKAFEFAAVGYLVKPFKVTDLQKTIDRILAQNMAGKTEKQPLKILIDSYNEQKIRKIVVPNTEGFTILLLDDILYLKSDRNYTEFIMMDKTKVVSSRSLIQFDQLLQSQGFFRVHHSYLINLGHLKAFVRSDGGAVKMANNELLPVSRQKKNDLLDRFY